jgi:hypothetical protein
MRIDFLVLNDQERYQYTIYSVNGQQMQGLETLDLGKGLHTIEADASALAPGEYIVTFHQPESGLTYEKRFIKQ